MTPEFSMPQQFHVYIESGSERSTLYIGSRRQDAATAFFEASINNRSAIVISVRSITFQSTGAAHVVERILAKIMPWEKEEHNAPRRP